MTLKMIQERLRDRTTAAKDELQPLKARAARLQAEIQNLVDVMASTPKAQASHLLAAMNEGHVELEGLKARIVAIETSPEAISLEVRRLEAESKRLLGNLRKAAQAESARALLAHLFNGPLTATPTETDDGPRLLIVGRASLQQMLTFESGGWVIKNPRQNGRPQRGSERW